MVELRSRQARGPLRRGLRVLALAGTALLTVGLLLFVPLAAYALLSPYSGVPVPRACTGGDEALPAPRVINVPGFGEGIVIAVDGPTTVAVVPAPDGRTAGGSGHVVTDRDVVFSVPIESRAVAAGIADGRAYLFDDKIGYFVDATTGNQLTDLFTVDNYRGLYVADGAEHVQTSLEVAFVGSAAAPWTAHGLPFGAFVDGCLLARVPR